MVKVYSRDFAFHSFHSKMKRIGHRIEVRDALNAVWDGISFRYFPKIGHPNCETSPILGAMRNSMAARIFVYWVERC